MYVVAVGHGHPPTQSPEPFSFWLAILTRQADKMNVNLPKLVNAALAEDQRGNKNVAIVSDNWTAPNHRDAGFLSRDFPKDPPRLIITAESDDFDQLTLAAWQDEGFLVEYLPMGDSGPDDYTHRLRELSTRKMGPCQTFGIIGESWPDCAGCMAWLLTPSPPPTNRRTYQPLAMPPLSAWSTTTCWTTTPTSNWAASSPTTLPGSLIPTPSSPRPSTCSSTWSRAKSTWSSRPR